MEYLHTFNIFVLQTPFVKDLMYDTCRPKLRCILQHSSQSKIALFTEAHAGSKKYTKKKYKKFFLFLILISS